MTMKALVGRQGWSPGSPDEVARNRIAALAGGRNGGTVQLAGADPSAVTEAPKSISPWSPRLYGTNVFTMFGGKDDVYLNPDDLASKKGLGVYSTMRTTDDMVSASSAYLQLAVLSPGWRFDPGDDTPEAIRAAEFQTWQADVLKGTYQQALLGRLDAAIRGFSVGEIVWAERETEGEWVGKQRIAQVQDKNPRYINFKLDPFGQVIEDGIVQETTMGSSTITVDLKEVVYWPFWPMDDNPYGTPLLRACYEPWFFKRFEMKLWARREEQRGHPPIIGRWKHDEPPSDEDKAAFLSFMKEWRQNMTGAISDTFELQEFNLARSNSENSLDVITTMNRAIARGMLLPALLMEKDSTGSLALGESHVDQFIWILDYIGAQLMANMNGQYVRTSHLLNYGPRVPCPVFRIKPHKSEDLLLKAQIHGALSLIGLPFDVRKMRDVFGDTIAVPKDNEEVAVGGRPAGGGLLRDDYSVLGRAFQPLPPQIPGASGQEVANMTEMVYEAVKGKLRAEKTYSFASRQLSPLEKLQNFAQQDADREMDLKEIEDLHILAAEAIATDLADLSSKQSGVRRLE
ncbi:MAG: DUF935 domain-containing protein [Anaerolineae bacterium]|nr:DUF935 domain-containing protein [Anaerolineae bacterium]